MVIGYTSDVHLTKFTCSSDGWNLHLYVNKNRINTIKDQMILFKYNNLRSIKKLSETKRNYFKITPKAFNLYDCSYFNKIILPVPFHPLETYI